MQTKTADAAKVHIPIRDSSPQDAPLARVPPAEEKPAPTRAGPSGPAAIFNRPRRAWWRKMAPALVVIGSVATGAILDRVVTRLKPFATPAPVTGAADINRILGPITLQGPGGPVTLPMATPAIVNIWLEGCQDCMPAVEAFHALKDHGALDVSGYPIVNVAYGGARPEWATEFGLDDRLVFDPRGSALVRPLGIGTFTTLIVDPDGWIRFKGRPDDKGFADRLSGAIRAVASGAPRDAKKTP